MSSAYMIGQKFVFAVARSLMYIRNNNDPRIEPWGTPVVGFYDRLCQKPLTNLEILPMVKLFCKHLSILCQLIQILPVQ